MGEIKRRAFFGPKPQILFIGANQKPLPLLAQIIFAITIRNRRQALAHRGHLWNGFGHEILMLCWLKRQGNTGHRGHLSPPETGGIHHPLRVNIALRGAHNPAAIGLGLCPHHRGETMNFRTPRPRAGRIGMGDT